ncbi:hypothetical protein BDV96DRAFT_293759 [Lophiotrema nucula]|uniref:Uncharacterized protein n=1 Tax=Lophiotrema nucula TaxID=690887 RepID=A0A6A5YKL9_9PLEO|nr:hypothetical protein BDV96DRAFT_293759 [Lophiotrema nucula]
MRKSGFPLLGGSKLDKCICSSPIKPTVPQTSAAVSAELFSPQPERSMTTPSSRGTAVHPFSPGVSEGLVQPLRAIHHLPDCLSIYECLTGLMLVGTSAACTTRCKRESSGGVLRDYIAIDICDIIATFQSCKRCGWFRFNFCVSHRVLQREIIDGSRFRYALDGCLQRKALLKLRLDLPRTFYRSPSILSLTADLQSENIALLGSSWLFSPLSSVLLTTPRSDTVPRDLSPSCHAHPRPTGSLHLSSATFLRRPLVGWYSFCGLVTAGSRRDAIIRTPRTRSTLSLPSAIPGALRRCSRACW